MDFKGRNKVSPEFSMASMTDIVFLLLIFFMLTSTLVAVDALDLQLPKAKGKTEKSQDVSVSITKDLVFYIDKKPVKKENLEPLLKARLRKSERPVIILRAEEGVPIEEVVYVMDIANRNNYKLILAVRPE
ncbi:MAG: biopolymer transporter ExbD [Chlorobi bacterium]|nr:biopolymer transporter ExbD [Chlorobiota bacterium]